MAEIQATKPEMTAEKFAKYDTDASGDISAAEYHAWKAAKADKNKGGDKASYERPEDLS